MGRSPGLVSLGPEVQGKSRRGGGSVGGAAWPGVSQTFPGRAPGWRGQLDQEVRRGDTALRLPLSKEHWVLRSMW